VVPGETVIAGIGQGYWVVTPIQLAQASRRSPPRACAIRCTCMLATQDGARRPPSAPPPESAAELVRDRGELGSGAAGHDRGRQRPTGTARAHRRRRFRT
jgi:penicillin-binding protein 2